MQYVYQIPATSRKLVFLALEEFQCAKRTRETYLVMHEDDVNLASCC